MTRLRSDIDIDLYIEMKKNVMSKVERGSYVKYLSLLTENYRSVHVGNQIRDRINSEVS